MRAAAAAITDNASISPAAYQLVRTFNDDVLHTSAFTIFSITACNVSVLLHFCTPSKPCNVNVSHSLCPPSSYLAHKPGSCFDVSISFSPQSLVFWQTVTNVCHMLSGDPNLQI